VPHRPGLVDLEESLWLTSYKAVHTCICEHLQLKHLMPRDYCLRVLHRKQATAETLAVALELYPSSTESHGFVNNAIMRELIRAVNQLPRGSDG
jgi:hypothetical protein